MRFLNTLNPNLTGDVLAFHTAFDQLINNHPTIPNDTEMGLSKDLIEEEMGELLKAMQDRNLPLIVDGAIDSVYVIVGMLVRMGVPFNPFWHEVQASNMSKVGGHKGPNGKWIKPDTYVPADIVGLLKYLGWSPPQPATVDSTELAQDSTTAQDRKHPDFPFIDPNYAPQFPIQKEGRTT